VLKPLNLLFQQIHVAMKRAMEEVLRDTGLTSPQASILTELAYGQAKSNAELARIQSVTPQTMAEMLGALERRGLISRSPKPEGGRAMPAELTREGQAKVLSVHLAMRQIEQRLLKSLSRDEVPVLRRLLEDCLQAIEKLSV
jgi:DNA-binding MarR family transcriptional regulator